MAGTLLHLSDLHVGSGAGSDVGDALRALVVELSPALVVATGDLSHRGRSNQLEAARELLGTLGTEMLCVPGNHDIPHDPSRLTRPWRRFEAVFGSATPAYVSETLAVVGLCSARPWRHQSGRVGAAGLAAAAETLLTAPPGALRVAALHHHVAGAPWRVTRKRPLRDRETLVRRLAEARVELVLGGHIHQSSAIQLREVTVDDAGVGGIVFCTAPGLGRPRPHRSGEAQGLHVVSWDEETLMVEARRWDGAAFVAGARRLFPRA
jgi:3',5'-cyclic AMP phosphodiesterase CpdA